MDTLQAAVLGTIQGLTEFLPVSSSGHLVIFQHLFGLTEAELAFDISVHLGTLVAVVIYFYRDLTDILRSVFRCGLLLAKGRLSFTDARRDPDFMLAMMICAGTLPTALLGVGFKGIADALFASVLLAGCMLVVTGLLLLVTRFVPDRPNPDANTKGPDAKPGLKQALSVGLVQGLAILPGISRSGSTIAAGLLLGLDRGTAARFSFLLSVPAIIGAALLGFKDLAHGSVNQNSALVIGALTSCIVGYLSLKFLVYIVKQGRLHLFAPYCLIAGILTVILGW